MSDGRLHFNKLVRDQVPENLKAKGLESEIRVLGDEEFEQELLKKAFEEAEELAHAIGRDEVLKELADLEDVLAEIKKLKAITDEELEIVKKQAFDKKGGFTKRLFLAWSSDDGYKSK